MTVCNVCGSSNFDLHDGHYFCRECNTKIENVGQRQEEESEYFENTSSQLTSVSSGKKPQEQKEKEFGEPWGTHECFNIIICKQVEKLIKLGASAQLKLVVFYLWAKYLKKCEIAFMGNEANEDWLPRLGTAPNPRDIFILYKGKTKLPNMYHKRKHESDSEEDSDDDQNEIIEVNGTESSNDSHCEIPSGNCSNIEPPVRVKKAKTKRKLMFNRAAEEKQKETVLLKDCRKRKKLKNFNDFMSIEKTAAFCHLGLLLTKDNILLFDLIRWAREDHFPYISCSSLLPSTMKLQSNDWHFITPYKAPDYEIVNEQAWKLVNFLEIDDVPERPLMPIIARFVTDMNLPYELLQFIHKLIEGKLPNWKTSGIPKYELIVMSIIITALKLLFGLNDDMERKLSALGRKLDHLADGLQPFIWEDWVQVTMQKSNFIYHTHAPSAIFSESDLFNVNSFRTFYEEAIYKHWQPRNSVLANAPYSTTEFRNTLRKTFSDLSKTEVAPVCPVTSFPLTSWTRYYKNRAIADDKLYSENFSHYSLAYIIKWKEFQQDPKLHDIYNCHLDHGALFDNCDKPSDNYILAHNQYWIHQVTKHNPSEPPFKSFKWLLSTCSTYVEVSVEKLYREQLNIEKLIFPELQKPKRTPQDCSKIPFAFSVRGKTTTKKRYEKQRQTEN